MSYCRNKKLKNYAVTGKLENIANKENIRNFQKPDAQYLYVNPIYSNNQLETYNTRRLEGGDYHSDVFYDCDSSIGIEDKKDEPLKVQQFHIYDVLNEIETPKEFKRALKQLIFNSQILYRTFRQAYRKTKKSHKTSTKSVEVRECEYCCQCSADKKIFQRKMDDGNIKNFVKPEDENKMKNMQKKRFSNVQPERKPVNTCNSCSTMKAPICECDTCSKYPPTMYQQTKYDTNDDYICEECAAFKGEMSTSKAIEKIYQNTRQAEHPNKYGSTSTGTPNNKNDQNGSTEDIGPIYLTIPVQLQIDPDVGNVRLLDTVDTVIQSTNAKETQTFVPQLTIAQQAQWTQPTQLAQPMQLAQPTQSMQPTQRMQPAQSTQPTLPNQLNRISEQTDLVMASQPISTAKNLDEGHRKSDKILKQQTKLDEIKMKTEQLRAELVKEIKLALEQTLPTEAIQGLKKGEFVALLSDNDKEMSNYVSAQDSKNDDLLSLPDLMEDNNETDDPTLLDRLSQSDVTIPIKDVQPEPIASDADAVVSENPSDIIIYYDPNVLNKSPDQYKAEGVQTTVSALKPFGHYQRNEMRRKIQQQLKELIEKKSEPSTTPKYTSEDRNEILFELHRLFHPVKSDLMASEQKRQNILHDIRYILDPNLPSDLKVNNLPASEEVIIDSVRYILNPKAEHKDKTKIRRYESGIKHKIMENFLIILKPSQERTPADQVTRNSAFLEVRLLLDTGAVQTSSRQIKKMVSSMRMRETKEQMEKLADLRYAQDPATIPQTYKEDKDDLNKQKPIKLNERLSTLGIEDARRQMEKLADQRYKQDTTGATASNRKKVKQEDLNQNKPATEKKQRRTTFQ